MVEGALEMCHGQALVASEPLDLAEDWRVCCIQLIGAESASWNNDIDRGRASKHRAGLHRRRVRAQDKSAFGWVDEERVHHRPGRMVWADVQRVKVQPFRLELWPL